MRFVIYMKCLLYTLLLTLIAFASPMQADSNRDALYIVEQHLIASGAQQNWETTYEDTLETLQEGVNKLGGEIIDSDVFMDELLGDFHEQFIPLLQKDGAEMFMTRLTSAELASLAYFYRSEEGQALIANGFMMPTTLDAAAYFHDGPGAPLRGNIINLWFDIGRMSQVHMDKIHELITMPRIVNILEMKDVVRFEDELQRTRVVGALRKLQ